MSQSFNNDTQWISCKLSLILLARFHLSVFFCPSVYYSIFCVDIDFFSIVVEAFIMVVSRARQVASCV